jgi:hypothetical protein
MDPGSRAKVAVAVLALVVWTVGRTVRRLRAGADAPEALPSDGP